jgi:RHS repeat-associated protein
LKKKYALQMKFTIFEILTSIQKMGCLKLTYSQNNDTLKVAYSLYRENQKYCTGSYRYGFNGKEKDDEINGNGNSVDFGARIYDSRLGRWLSVDPLVSKYPYLSPFNFVANSPIMFIDPDGKRIVDGKGNVIADINPETGKVEFAAGINERTKALLTKATSTETGNNVVKNAITAKHDIKITVNKYAVLNGGVVRDPKSSDKGKSPRTGETHSDLTADGKDFKSSDVQIHEGTIKFIQENDVPGRVDYSKYTKDEAGAAVLIHELTHATDKNSNGKINKAGTHENNPQSNQDCFLKEIDQAKPAKPAKPNETKKKK